MDFSIWILVVAVAAVAYFYWNQRKGSGPDGARKPGAPLTPPPAANPTAAPAAAPSASASAAPARPMAAAAAAGGPAASYDEYRRVSPSNMVYGKLTCNRCGSNRIRVEGGTAGCMSCGAALYRA
jgi:hypothetical protein